nr:hypothetical protein [uncultured Shewanella sp.]
MEMPTVKLKFTDCEESTSLLRVPVAGDWINVRGDEYQVTKVILSTDKSSTVVVIESELKTPKKKAVPAPRHG